MQSDESVRYSIGHCSELVISQIKYLEKRDEKASLLSVPTHSPGFDPLPGFFFKPPNADEQRRAILSDRRETAGAVNLAGMWARPTGDINGVTPVSFAAEQQFIQVSFDLIHGSLLKNPS